MPRTYFESGCIGVMFGVRPIIPYRGARNKFAACYRIGPAEPAWY